MARGETKAAAFGLALIAAPGERADADSMLKYFEYPFAVHGFDFTSQKFSPAPLHCERSEAIQE